MEVSFKKIGNWEVAKQFCLNLDEDIKSVLPKALAQIGLEGEAFMKKYIVGQQGKWKALSRRYKARKKKQGFSTKILIRSSTMVQSITSIPGNMQVFIGVKRGKKDGDMDVANIAAIMEFGSKKQNIPARKFMKPTYEEMTRRIAKENLFQTRILNLLKKKYGMK